MRGQATSRARSAIAVVGALMILAALTLPAIGQPTTTNHPNTLNPRLGDPTPLRVYPLSDSITLGVVRSLCVKPPTSPMALMS